MPTLLRFPSLQPRGCPGATGTAALTARSPAYTAICVCSVSKLPGNQEKDHEIMLQARWARWAR